MQPFLTAFYELVVPTAILLPKIIYSSGSIEIDKNTFSAMSFLLIKHQNR